MKHKVSESYELARILFIETFNNLSRHKSRYAVFSDFIRLSANKLDVAANIVGQAQTFKDEVNARYSCKEVLLFETLYKLLVDALNLKFHDFLGSIFMELELGNDDMGQYFTPDCLSRVVTELTMDDYSREIKRHGYVMIHEPTSGAGGLVISVAGKLMSDGHNPSLNMFVSCIDIDYDAADMCFVQLSLLGIPAEIITGNSLTLKINRIRYIPVYYINGFNDKIKFRMLYEALETLK